MSRKEVKRELIRGVYGSPEHWVYAARLARDNGWTSKEISRVLTIYHPSTWAIPAVVVVALLAAFLSKAFGR